MSSRMKELAIEIERLGANVLHLTQDDLKRQLSYDLTEMEDRGFDSVLIAQHRRFNKMIDQFVGHSAFGEYLASATPQEMYLASGVRVLTLSRIFQEITELAPTTYLFPLGYTPFASSIGGNAICFDLNSNRVVWADHSEFLSDSITFYDSASELIVELPFTPENVASRVTQLHEDFLGFFFQLTRGELEEQLDQLD
jgi:hypothetical protein